MKMTIKNLIKSHLTYFQLKELFYHFQYQKIGNTHHDLKLEYYCMIEQDKTNQQILIC